MKITRITPEWTNEAIDAVRGLRLNDTSPITNATAAIITLNAPLARLAP